MKAELGGKGQREKKIAFVHILIFFVYYCLTILVVIFLFFVVFCYVVSMFVFFGFFVVLS